MNPTYAQAMALLNTIQPNLRQAITDQLNGHPRAQAYDTDKTTGGGGSDPTATAAIVPDRARHDLEQYTAAVVRIYTAAMCLAHLSDHYEPAHEPRRGDIMRDTKGCIWHEQAGVDIHRPVAHRTDFASTLDSPLKESVAVCQACYDFVRSYRIGAKPSAARPTNEELVRHHRTGKWTARVSGAFSVESVAATRPSEAA